MWGVRLKAPNYVELVKVPKVVPLCCSSKLFHTVGNYKFPRLPIMHMYRPLVVALLLVLF